MNVGKIAASACKAARVVGHISRSSLPGRSHCVRHVDIKQLSRCFSSKIPSRRLGDNSEASSGQSSASEASTGALHGQSPPYKNKFGFDTLHIGPDPGRSLTITKFPSLVIEDDIRELFEESGFYPDRIHMMYDHRGLTTGYIHVVMSSPEEADRAMHELNGVPLYTKTVKIVPYMKLESRGEYSLSWGWYANKSNSLKDVRLRYPHTTPPRSIFDSYRESRSIAILRDDLIKPMYKLSESLYGLLHAYDVLNTHSVIYKYSTGKKAEQRSMCEVVFATTEAADTVCQVYNGTVWHGSKLTVGLRRPPTRLLGGSWEASHNRAHYQPRDLGSAKGTNLEKEEELMFRKWILNDQDRGIYVAGHRY